MPETLPENLDGLTFENIQALAQRVDVSEELIDDLLTRWITIAIGE